MESEECAKAATVSTSSTDVYSPPISLSFEAGGMQSEEVDETVTVSTSSTVVYSAPISLGFEEPATCLLTYNKDIRDDTAVRGRCGLYNLGNTCFMNSGLQCLMSTLPLVKFLLEYYQTKRAFDNTLFGMFHRLFAKIWSGHFSIIHTKEFKQTLGIYHTQFQDYRQHDCQEFLALLLDSLHEQLNFRTHSTNQNIEAGPSCEKQPISFEYNINNRATSNLTVAEEENRVMDNSKTTVASHSSLTFDNMKESKSGPSGKVGTNELKSEKRKSASTIVGFTINQISEDSNHSTVSEQSSDSEQCSVMKNLKLRSSPNTSQSSRGLPPRHLNEFGAKNCDVSSSVDGNIKICDMAVECSSSRPEAFKRVHSLHNFQIEEQECANSLMKASSDNDLVNKASSDINEAGDCENVARMDAEADFIRMKTVSTSLMRDICDNESTTVFKMAESKSEPIVLNNSVSTTSVPSLEDLYAKETKILNTNVLVTAYMEESVATDSDKFSKHDNTDELVEEVDIINVMEVTPKNNGLDRPKKVKDVNIRADKKKSPKGAFGSNSGTSSDKEDCFAQNCIKRMKFEGTEKNLQMQEICKIQKESLISEILKATKPKNDEKVGGISCTREASPSVDSDIESDFVEDQEDDNEMEISDNEAEVLVARSPHTLTEGACYTNAEVVAAEDAWQKYLRRNDSVIVDTFQGQFKSTVICARCSKVSVTFEPFMYLSVPVPHAMERQLCVTLISMKCEPTQLLLEMHKHDKILHVKQQLCNVIGGQPIDIIIAEVFNWHVSRILEDNTMLRYINDSSRKIYAFEMDQSTACSLQDKCSTSDGIEATPANSRDSITAQADTSEEIGNYSVSSSVSFESNLLPAASSSDQVKLVGDEGNRDVTRLWQWHDDAMAEKRGERLETESGDSVMADSTTTAVIEAVAKDKSTVSSSTVTMDEWKSCAICLEEMPENDLMVHTTCGGTFCSPCLEMSVQHYRDSVYCCPVCSTPADMTEDFVPLTNAANHKPKTRIVAIPITFRFAKDISGADDAFVFAHPLILNLPSNLTGQHIYSCIQAVRPNISHFTILLTDGTGLHCSRCLYMEHCSGCEISRHGEAILRPGDHLSVSVQSVTEEEIAEYQMITNDKSMETQRSSDPVTLLDCFTAFTKSEELDEHNPWFCPHCKENQRAEKSMTVWQYPDTLIIHLKRFVFHELSSTKVDKKVMFPLDDLDLNQFLSGPKTKNLVYNLCSLVCHFGGAHSGHYAAYAKHPVDGKWYYYNDENVTESSPSEDEYMSTYVLFYQRKGTDKALQIPDDLELAYDPDDEEHVSTDSPPSVVFQPTEDINLNLNNTALSTSCHTSQVAPSSGTCDLLDSGDQADTRTQDIVVDSSYVRAELATADSTGPSYDFYS